MELPVPVSIPVLVGEVTLMTPDPVNVPVVERFVSVSVPPVDVTLPEVVSVPLVRDALENGSVAVGVRLLVVVKMEPPRGLEEVSVAAVENWLGPGKGNAEEESEVVIGGMGVFTCASTDMRHKANATTLMLRMIIFVQR